MKSVFARLLIAAFAVCIITWPGSIASAQEINGTFGDSITWTLSDHTLTVYGQGAIPDAEDYGKTPWDEYRDQVERIVIEEDITSVGDYAFWSFENLISVSFESGIQSIGFCSFMHCPSLTELSFPESLTRIGSWSFAKCENLSRVSFPVSVSFIDEFAFFKCHNLTEIYYEGCQQQWDQIEIVMVPEEDYEDDSLFHAAMHFEGEIKESGVCGDNVSWSLTNGGILRIAGTGSMYNGADYGDMPWNDCKDQIRAIIVEDGITSIGDYAFWDCGNCTAVSIGKDVVSVGKAAFLDCEQVPYLELPDGLETIADRAFIHCHGLGWIFVPSSVTSIGELCLEECTCTILYQGTETQWNNIQISADNGGLFSLPVEYGYAFVTCHHDYYSEVLVAPTCMSEGIMRYTCTLCDEWTEGHSYTRKIPREHHHFANGRCTNLLADGSVCGTSITTTKNYVYFTEPADGLTLEHPGSVEIRLLYTSNGVFAGGAIGNHYITYVAVTKESEDGAEAIYAETSTPVTLDFVHDFRFATVNLPENGEYVFHVATADGFNDRDEVRVTVGQVYKPSGTIGDLEWVLSKEGVLTISGTGPMSDFENDTPWDRSAIREIVIEEGVTGIGLRAFCECEGLKRIDIPSSLERIGEMAFAGCEGLENVFFQGSAAQWREIEIGQKNDELVNVRREYGIPDADFVLPGSLERIEGEAFAGIRDVAVALPEDTEVAEDAFEPSVVFYSRAESEE